MQTMRLISWRCQPRSRRQIGARVGISIDLDAKRATFHLDQHGRASMVDCDFSQLVTAAADARTCARVVSVLAHV